MKMIETNNHPRSSSPLSIQDFSLPSKRQSGIRRNIKDIWSSFMVRGADFSASNFDIPFCPTTADSIPTGMITFSEAKRIYAKKIREDKDFQNSSFVCFYEDDQYFDGSFSGIWNNPRGAYNVLKHFKGIITPDFSTYQDFPSALKIYNTYRMRAFGYWYGRLCHKEVINNVRWGTDETFAYCFDSVPTDSIVAIGTVGGSPRKLIGRARFEKGLTVMIDRLRPKTILVYGSAKYPCFTRLKDMGVSVIEYPSRTASYFEKRRLEE